MKTKTVTVNEGENLGPIDPNWDYEGFKNNHLRGRNEDAAWEAIKSLGVGDIVTDIYSYSDKKVLAVGMYDGWPFWFPVPSVYLSGTLGGEWHPFYYIRSVRKSQKEVA